MSKMKKCILQSSSDKYPSIEVTEEKKFLGRSPETQIQALHCSKKQLKVSDAKEPTLLINRLGSNTSFLNGTQINLFGLVEAKDGDKLEIVPAIDFYYTVTFGKSQENSQKRRASTELGKENKQSQEPPKKSSKIDVETWNSIDDGKLYIFTSRGVEGRTKVASYDLDGTIIKTKSGNVFAKNIDDWQIAYNEVPGKLKKLLQTGFKIVFFTNQAGISTGKLKIADFKKKVERIVSKLNIPVQVFASTGKSRYRKPITGMWDYFVDRENDGVRVNIDESFYCGDAAGRPELKKPVKRKKDFSSSDRMFALNLGIPFFTPEEHFLGKPTEAWTKPEFDPTILQALPLTIPGDAVLAQKTKPEVIVMVGSPASGKSHFARTIFADYVYISRDEMGTWQKCRAALEKALKEKKSAVIDNTNPDLESRKRYIETAKSAKVPCRCFLMLTTEKQAKHNNAFREIIDPSHSVLGAMVFTGYRSKFKEPSLKEGFQEIVRVNFVPKFDDNPEHEKLYRTYLVDN